MRRTLFGLTLVAAILSVAPPADASEKTEIPADVDSKTLKNAEERFKREFDTEDIEFKLRALTTYAKVQHKNIAKSLIKMLKSKDQYVRAGAAEGLAYQLSSVKAAGPKLTKLAETHDEEPRVLKAAVKSIGALDYRRGMDALETLTFHDDDGVVIEVMKVYGAWKDPDSLKTMRKFFEKWPDEKGFITVTAAVDTGTAGSGDQRAAEALGRGMLAAHKGWRPRPKCTEALRDAAKEITGFGFRRPQDLAHYLNDPKSYVDPERVVDRVDEDKRKAIYVEWHAAKKTAREYAAGEVEGDDPKDGDRRAKVYGRRLYDIRDEMLEAHELRLSELDVIVEEGEEKKWPTGQPDE